MKKDVRHFNYDFQVFVYIPLVIYKSLYDSWSTKIPPRARLFPTQLPKIELWNPYRTLAMVRPSPKLTFFKRHWIKEREKLSSRVANSSCRRRRNNNFLHFCRVIVSSEWRVRWEDLLFGPGLETLTQILNEGSDVVCLTDATKIVRSWYLTRKLFDKILDDRSTFSVFRLLY